MDIGFVVIVVDAHRHALCRLPPAPGAVDRGFAFAHDRELTLDGSTEVRVPYDDVLLLDSGFQPYFLKLDLLYPGDIGRKLGQDLKRDPLGQLLGQHCWRHQHHLHDKHQGR